MVQLFKSFTVVSLRFNRCDGEGAGAVDGWDAVLLQRTGTPTVDATHAAVLAVKRQYGKF
jgi:hypothetical protein